MAVQIAERAQSGTLRQALAAKPARHAGRTHQHRARSHRRQSSPLIESNLWTGSKRAPRYSRRFPRAREKRPPFTWRRAVSLRTKRSPSTADLMSCPRPCFWALSICSPGATGLTTASISGAGCQRTLLRSNPAGFRRICPRAVASYCFSRGRTFRPGLSPATKSALIEPEQNRSIRQKIRQPHRWKIEVSANVSGGFFRNDRDLRDRLWRAGTV